MSAINYNSFFKVPKELFNLNLTSDAKILYTLMLDRFSLSKSNNRYDSKNRLYINFSVTSACKALNCSRNKAIKVFKALEESGLIYIEKQERGMNNIIYLGRQGSDEQAGSKTNNDVVWETNQGSSNCDNEVVSKTNEGSSNCDNGVVSKRNEDSSNCDNGVVSKRNEGSSNYDKQVVSKADPNNTYINNNINNNTGLNNIPVNYINYKEDRYKTTRYNNYNYKRPSRGYRGYEQEYDYSGGEDLCL